LFGASAQYPEYGLASTGDWILFAQIIRTAHWLGARPLLAVALSALAGLAVSIAGSPRTSANALPIRVSKVLAFLGLTVSPRR
jgi:hypothetical protein